MKFIFTLRGWAFDLIKAVVNVAPECCAPALVEVFDRAIFFFQPFSELRLAQRAMAFSTELVGDVPGAQRRVVLIALGQ